MRPHCKQGTTPLDAGDVCELDACAPDAVHHVDMPVRNRILHRTCGDRVCGERVVIKVHLDMGTPMSSTTTAIAMNSRLATIDWSSPADGTVQMYNPSKPTITAANSAMYHGAVLPLNTLLTHLPA